MEYRIGLTWSGAAPALLLGLELEDILRTGHADEQSDHRSDQRVSVRMGLVF